MELIGALGIYLRISVNSTNIFELNSMDFCNLQMVSRLVGTYNIWGVVWNYQHQPRNAG